MNKVLFFISFLLLIGCKNTKNSLESKGGDSSVKSFTDFKIEDSKFIDMNSLFEPFDFELSVFSKAKYEFLKPLIMNNDIPTLQKNISKGILSYKDLTIFYLYRIKNYDRMNEKSLNSVISLNPEIIEQAIEKDKNRPKDLSNYSIYGMPILLKDNINSKGLITTAGAVALMDNITDDSFLVAQLKASGALILGKTNLSEWAYFFCGNCPSGYSAVGGQTFNPYGRKTIDTGGSSSGSAVAVTANFCAAAVGSETSGSILSPSSQNACVGLKPTIGAVSRCGIVPISSTLDTAGPITRYVIDNILLFNSMIGKDNYDSKSKTISKINIMNLSKGSIIGKRVGVVKEFLNDSVYDSAVQLLKREGAVIITVEPKEVDLPNFLKLLNLDMKVDLPNYLKLYANNKLPFDSVKSIVDFNKNDSLNRAPYGQKLFEGIIADETTDFQSKKIKSKLKTNGRAFFDSLINNNQLDVFLSINNYHAGYAAVAEYPALTVPMGLSINGEPRGLTFISKSFKENDLYFFGYNFENFFKKRPVPKNYN